MRNAQAIVAEVISTHQKYQHRDGPPITDELLEALRISVDELAAEAPSAQRLVCTVDGCEEPIGKCLKHTLWQLLRERGKSWIMSTLVPKFMQWMAEAESEKREKAGG